MTSHLSADMIAALADGELQAVELAAAQEHLTGCAACTRDALEQALLKAAAARAGRKYVLPAELSARLSRQIAQEVGKTETPQHGASRRSMSGFSALGWAAAVILLVAATLSGRMLLKERNANREMAVASANNALISEAFDQHVATLAASGSPQVISSDNHTVKPWFQGRLPFAFNLPERLPDGMALDGANFTYVGNQPTAQLLFSIGRHRVSVFLTKNTTGGGSNELPSEHSGFHVVRFASGELEGTAISDVNPARLAELVGSLARAQDGGAK